MTSGLSPDDPTLVDAFRSALLHQGAIALAIVVFLLLLWATAKTWRGTAKDEPGETIPRNWTSLLRGPDEPLGRTVLRVGFGLLWLLDGFLQAQPQMAGGLPAQVIAPAAQGSPAWVLHL